MTTRYPVPSRYQVAVTLAVSILSGLSAGLALPLIFFGNSPLAMFLTPVAVISAVICWRVCPEEHWLQLRATLLMAALPTGFFVFIIYLMRSIH